MLNFFAHADELHKSNAENLKHLMELWYSALPIYILIFSAIVLAAYYISKKSAQTVYIVSSVFLLISGVFLYDLSPIVSTVAIIVGLFGSMAIAFLGISKK